MELIRSEIKNAVEEKRSEISAKFFKTEEGDYGSGDIFLGVRNGEIRKIVQRHWARVGFSEIKELLNSTIHEERLSAVLLLVEKYQHGDEDLRRKVFNFYIENAKFVNNWDLVDLSSWKIIGEWLRGKRNKNILKTFAKSNNLWKRRIAIVSTFAFIRRGEIKETLEIAKILLGDSHDLIHKATGWMLREVGKKDAKALKEFLKKNYDQLPRTTLRYAIERFNSDERKRWLINAL